MRKMVINMLIVGIILIWIILGFVTYLWNIKETYTTYFDIGEFILCIIFAPIVFSGMLVEFLYRKFIIFMENLIRKINKN